MNNLNLAEIAFQCQHAVNQANWAYVKFTSIFIDGHGTLYSGERVSYR